MGNARGFDSLFGKPTGNTTGIIFQGQEWFAGYLVQIMDTFDNKNVPSTTVLQGIDVLDSTDIVAELEPAC